MATEAMPMNGYGFQAQVTRIATRAGARGAAHRHGLRLSHLAHCGHRWVTSSAGNRTRHRGFTLSRSQPAQSQCLEGA
jgi:hypothetical protein